MLDEANWCRDLELNQGHEALQATALPTELSLQNGEGSGELSATPKKPANVKQIDYPH